MLVYHTHTHTHTSVRTHRHTRISTHKHSDTHTYTHTLKLMCVSSCLHFHVCHRRRRRCPARCAVIRTSSSPGLALHRNTHTLYRTHSASYTDAHSVAHKHTHSARIPRLASGIVLFYQLFRRYLFCFFLPLLSSSSSSAPSASRVCSFSFQKK